MLTRTSAAVVLFTLNGITTISTYKNGETVTVLAGKGDDSISVNASFGVTWRVIFAGQDGNDRLVGSLAMTS